MNLYTDLDPKVCAWTQELVNEGLIATGEVVCKSITEITPDELQRFTQCHFFNGISGWAHALDLAGWSRTRPVWCASLPCQSFSCAGKGQGFGDDRGNLWFPFLGLVRKCRPLTIFGEQVKAAIGHGWLDRIFTDLEKEGYTCGAAVLGAHSVGAPHLRQRLCWVADTQGGGLGTDRSASWCTGHAAQCDEDGGMALTNGGVFSDGGLQRGGEHLQREEDAAVSRLADTEHDGRRADEPRRGQEGRTADGRHSEDVRMGDANNSGLEGRSGQRCNSPEEYATTERNGAQAGFWDSAIWHVCRDGKGRRISPEPALFPLANGIPGRVGLLRGAGNAIVPQVAAEFIKAYLESEQDLAR